VRAGGIPLNSALDALNDWNTALKSEYGRSDPEFWDGIDGSALESTTASANAMPHGILSSRLSLENEDPAKFQQLQFDLHASLGPVGAIELALIERIAIPIWRQRRLVAAETASLNLNLDRGSIAKGVNAELDRTYWDDAISEADLQPYDIEQERWCKVIVAEIEGLDDISLEAIRAAAPLVLVQLKTETDDDQVEPDAYLNDYAGGVMQFISELRFWCQK
jgi:hypothetical protein